MSRFHSKGWKKSSHRNQGHEDSRRPIPREDHEEDHSDFNSHKQLPSISLYMWEFGQNNSSIDSGSKLCRFGYANAIRLNQNFFGIVLSSEASNIVSPIDREIVLEHGISGINCSWNRLDEIPFSKLGKAKFRRKLPLLVAANTVNYGKPFKMNTAEAIAATLYITGFKEDAQIIMAPFSYGMEFLRLNEEALETYASCADESAVREAEASFVRASHQRQTEKEQRKACNNSRETYLDESDLPPLVDDEEEYEDEEEEEGEGEKEEES